MKIYISFLKVNSCLIVGSLLSSENLLAFVLQHTTLQQFIIYAERLGGLNNSLKKCALSQGKSESAESGNFLTSASSGTILEQKKMQNSNDIL